MFAEGRIRSEGGAGAAAAGAGVAAGAGAVVGVAGVEESARTGPLVEPPAEPVLLPELDVDGVDCDNGSAQAEPAVSPKSTPEVTTTASETPSQVFKVRLRFDLMLSPSIQLS